MTTAYILDDEQHAHVVLKTLIQRHFETDINVVGTAQTVDVALLEISALKPDLLFLDIEMPNTNGMEMISRVNTEDCSVIFVTAYDNFAVEAYNKMARGYLLKPVDKEKFKNTVSDVLRKITIEKKAKRIPDSLIDSLSDISVPHNGDFVQVDPNKVLYFQADGSYTKISTDKVNYYISKNLKTVTEEFNQDFFIRVNRSFVVNKNNIKTFSKKNGGNIHLTNDLEISVSGTYRDLIFDLLNSSIEN